MSHRTHFLRPIVTAFSRFLGVSSLLLTESGAGPAFVGAQQTPAPATTIVTRQIARGVQFAQYITPAHAPGGPLIVSVLRVNLKEKDVRVEAALGGDQVWGNDPTLGREVVSTLAARRGAVAGVNAGFFPFAGNPLGLHVENGEIVTEPNGRAVFGLTKGGAIRIGIFGYQGSVTAPRGSAPLDGLNRRPGNNDKLLLFTPRFFDATLKTTPTGDRFEVTLANVALPLAAGKTVRGSVSRVSPSGGQSPLAPGSVVLSGSGAGADFLRAHAALGALFTVRLGVTPDASDLAQAVTGAPRLLTDGRVTITAAQEKVGSSFVTTRHPRTAAGVTSEGVLLLVVVDGRQSDLSRGASLPELAAILLKLGARDAVNLDGGGSSALIAQNSVVSSPSEGKERPIADALLVFAPVDPAAPQRPLILQTPLLAQQRAVSGPAQAALQVGDRAAFALRDGAGRVLSDHGRVVWGTSGGVGFVTQRGIFHALRAGVGAVRVTLGQHVTVVDVTVTAARYNSAAPAGSTPRAPTMTPRP